MKRATYFACVTSCCLLAGLALIHVTNGSGTAEESAKAPDIGFGNNLSVGTVLMWWGSRDTVPAGWEICDGEMPRTSNAILTVKKPNLVDRFPKGAISSRKSITDLTQATGGSNNMPALRINKIDSLKIVEDGAHTHAPLDQKLSAAGKRPGAVEQAISKGAGKTDNAATTAGTIVQARNTNESTPAQEGAKAVAAAGNSDSNEGMHSHDIKGFIGSENGINADGDDKSGANQPAFAELFFIIRVK